MTHVLLKNEDDRWALCWKYLQFKTDLGKIWRDEDLPLIKPFLDFRGSAEETTKEVQDSVKHYKKCWKEYAEELDEISRSVDHFTEEQILETVGYEHEEDIFEDDNDCYCKNPVTATQKPTKDLLNLEYPVIAVVWIDSDCDRMGKFGHCCVDFIEKKEFDK